MDAFDWGMTWAQRPLLFRNRGGTRFEEAPAAPGSGLAVVVPARGAAFGDLDGDGRVDVVLNNHDRGPTLLRNVAPAAGHWVTLRLVGGERGPRDAIGAVVMVDAGGRRWRRDVISGGSYCSQSDLRVHVGLGNATRIDAVTVRWPGPDRRRERFTVTEIDRVVTLTEGRGQVVEGDRLDAPIAAEAVVDRERAAVRRNAADSSHPGHLAARDPAVDRDPLARRDPIAAREPLARRDAVAHRKPFVNREWLVEREAAVVRGTVRREGRDVRVRRASYGTDASASWDSQESVPAAAAPHVREAVAAQRREAWEDAARAYQRAVEIAPGLAEAHANLGVALSKLGRIDEAIAAYERALSLAPDLQAARINLGLAHFRVGAIGRAVELFDSVLRREPSSEQARGLLGLALVDAGRDADAVPHLEAASAAAPENPALLFALGRAYAALPDADTRAPGAALSGSRRVDAVAARLSTLPAGRPLWQHLQGLLLQRQGKHREALDAFEAARAAQPQLPGLALATGVSLLALGEDARAREAFEQARALAPRDGVPLFYLAWTHERAGQAVEARRQAERAVALDPDLVEARTLLGRVLMAQGEFSEAARHLALATAGDAEDASTRYLLAQAYQRAGDTVAARREFEEARRLKAREVAHERSQTSGVP